MFGKNNAPLFYRNGQLNSYLVRKTADLVREIEASPDSYILGAKEDELIAHLGDRYEVEPVQIDVDGKTMTSREEVFEVLDYGRMFYRQGLLISVEIPFTGDSELFKYTPSTFTSAPPYGDISKQSLMLHYRSIDNNAQAFIGALERDLGEIQKYLGWVNSDLMSYNTNLRPEIKRYLDARKAKLQGNHAFLSALGIPMKKRAGLPETFSLPVSKKKAITPKPVVPQSGVKPDPTVTPRDYEEILEIVFNMTMLMERSPKTFSKLGEEEIRDHFLLHLNGAYEGNATGETFNYSGKTDILVRENGSNVFISECKFWAGEKGFLETIDQILRYTSWRDTKTAVFLFVKNQKFTGVLEKISTAIKKHPNFKNQVKFSNSKLANETVFGCKFFNKKDESRELFLTVMAFNIQ